MLKFGFPFVSIALAVGAARADTMVCTTNAGVMHCEAPLRHYRVTGTREGNRIYFEGPPLDDDRRRRADHHHPPLKRFPLAGFVSSSPV